ncbi:ATP-binding protein [Kribbella sp. NBC_00662]|uniref:ATP-binding protein n=1 Tax=Kribbella sp. NBC_00662 TaxID=2975969 RepID=UPI00324CA618
MDLPRAVRGAPSTPKGALSLRKGKEKRCHQSPPARSSHWSDWTGQVDPGYVGSNAARPDLRLAGRGVEQRLLADALKATAGGRPCALVVHGDAGVGKTRLVREVCGALGADSQVLWGTCVHYLITRGEQSRRPTSSSPPVSADVRAALRSRTRHPAVPSRRGVEPLRGNESERSG